MRSGYKITLGILTMMILFTITVGTSYSYYSISKEQRDPNELTSGCFDISFTDADVINMSASGNYMYPMSEVNALAKLTPYKFTITNNCTAENSTRDMKYIVTLNTLNTTPSTLTNYLNYKLNITAPSALDGTTAKLTTTPYDLNPSVKTEEDIDVSYKLAEGTLPAGASTTFNLYLWITEEAGNEVMGLDFTGKVLVYTYV